MKNKRKWGLKIAGAVGILIVLALLALFMFSGENFLIIKGLFDENVSSEQLYQLVKNMGFRGAIPLSLLSMMQVVLTFAQWLALKK